jgi:hypothetical protein
MIRAIGFEGVPAPQRQPARLSAIFVDEDNCRVVWKGNGFKRLSNRALTHIPSASTTRIDPPIEAVGDSSFLVLDSRDMEMWQAESTKGELPGPAKVGSQIRSIGGMCHAWLCTPSAALRVLSVLRDETVWKLGEAIKAKDTIRVYELAWRVHRCAVNDDDVFMAVAGLEQSIHPDQAADLTSGYFGEMPVHDRNMGLGTARMRLSALLQLVP